MLLWVDRVFARRYLVVLRIRSGQEVVSLFLFFVTGALSHTISFRVYTLPVFPLCAVVIGTAPPWGKEFAWTGH